MSTIAGAFDADQPIQGEIQGVDLNSESFLADCYSHYARLREHQPVCRTDGGEAYLITRYDDVKAAFASNRFQINFERLQLNRAGEAARNEAWYLFGREFVAFRDPPQHGPLKKLLMQGFTRTRAEQHLPVIRRLVDEAIDSFISDGRTELTAGFATEVPRRVISGILGVPAEDQVQMSDWVQDYAPVLGFPQMSADQVRRANDASLGWNNYFGRTLEARRRAPDGDDLVSELLRLNEAEGGLLDDMQIVANLIILYFGGQDTQKNQIGNILVALHDHPEQLAWLQEDPSRIWNCVNELMRHDSVAQIIARVAMEDVEVRGTVIPEGSTLLLSTGAANRDPAIFSNPDQLDLKREGAEYNVTFGVGAHVCLGAHFAKLTVPAMLEGLLRRIPKLQIDRENLVRAKFMNKRGYAALPVFW